MIIAIDFEYFTQLFKTIIWQIKRRNLAVNFNF